MSSNYGQKCTKQATIYSIVYNKFALLYKWLIFFAQTIGYKKFALLYKRLIFIVTNNLIQHIHSNLNLCSKKNELKWRSIRILDICLALF